MRSSRTSNEQVNGRHITKYLRDLYPGQSICELTIHDCPDYAFTVGQQIVAVELAQIPSNYIIRHHYGQRKRAVNPEGATGLSVVWPIEPHMWVHAELLKKFRNIPVYRRRAKADQVWLALHSYSEADKWLLSSGREWQSHMLRFGASRLGKKFDRVIVIFSDGIVRCISGDGEAYPTSIGIDLREGYPTQSFQNFSLPIDVPLPGLGEKRIDYGEIQFKEIIIKPLDSFLRRYRPRIDRPRIFARSTSDSSNSIVWINFGSGWNEVKFDVSNRVGERIYFHCVAELPGGFMKSAKLSLKF